MKKFLLPVLFFLVFSGCDRQKVYEQFNEIKDLEWRTDDIQHFNAGITDTSEIYNVLISYRNTARYEYSNLYLFVTVHSPDGNMVRDTVEVMLADESGKWLGKGAASVFTGYYVYRQNIKFPVPGIYTFDIEQAMWKVNLKNISDIGIRIEKANRQKK
jgi:gliding motility-associated lipoprotein GldH